MINAANYRSEYTGSGLTGPFAYGFPLANKAYVAVTKTSVAGVVSTLVVDSDYTVSGVSNSDTATWYVTLTVVLATGEKLTLTPNYPLLQKRDFNNQGGFFPETHESSADESRIIDQQLQEQIDRCLKSELGSGILPDDLLASITSSANSAAASEASALNSADEAAASATSAVNAAANVVVATYEGTATEGQTAITVTPSIDSLPTSLDYIECFLDGVNQAKSTLTRTSSSVLTVGGAMAAGTKIVVKAGKFAGSASSPFSFTEVKSDFFEISSTVAISGFRGETNGTGSVASIWTGDSGGPVRDQNVNLGWLELRAGTSASASATMYYGGAYGGDGNDQTGRWGCPIDIRLRIHLQTLSDATNNYTLLLGQGWWNGERAAFFRYNHAENSGNWVCVMDNGAGSETVFNTSVAVATGTAIDLQILFSGSGVCRYFINGVEQGSGISATTPALSIAFNLAYARIQSNGTNPATRSVWIDKAYLNYGS